jgi:hypothetical protein
MRTDFRNYPYGAYLCENAIVYFDRRYRPIVRITQPYDEASVTVRDSLEWIEHSGQEWLYNDGNPPRYDAQTRNKLKRLMDAIPEMAEEVRRRNRSERRMRTLPPRRWADERYEHHTQLYGL